MINSEIKRSVSAKTERDYPWLGELKTHPGQIILFDKPGHGVVVRCGNHGDFILWEVGKRFEQFTMKNFKAFYGDVTLTQEKE